MFCYLSKVTTLHPQLLAFVDVQLGYLLRNGLIFWLHLNLIATRSFIKNKTCTFFSDWNVRCTIWVTFGAISNFRLPCFRYVEANVRRSSLYRKYNEILPQWFSNKPKKFVDHCIEKIGLAKCIPLQNISKVDENTYLVQTSKNSPTYNVRLLNNSKLPFCECEAWRNTLLPCKHIGLIWAYQRCFVGSFTFKLQKFAIIQLRRRNHSNVASPRERIANCK